MDIYARLTKDHEVQRELLSRIDETHGDSAERRTLFEQLRVEAEAHASAEEQTFYAVLIGIPDGQEKARHSVSEHKEAADLIEELDAADMSSGGWLVKFRSLREALEHHVKEEEDEIFKCAQQLIDDKRASELAGEFDTRKAAELKREA